MTDREKLIELLHKGVRCPGTVSTCEYDCPYWSLENPCDAFAATADMLIANGVVVRAKGEWVLGHVEPGYCTPGGNRPWICPKCGSVISWRLDKPTENFCPNCGADMRKGRANV